MAGSQIPYPAPAPTRQARTWPWVLLALGIAALVALLGLGVFAVCSTAARQLAAGTCLPRDFPKYEGTTTVGWRSFEGTSGSTCDMSFQSGDSADQVTAFYQARLNQGDWRVLSASEADGTITFERVSNGRQHGKIQVYGRGTESSFEVHFSS